MVSEIVHSVLSDNTNRRVTTIEETATKTATTATVKQPKKKAGTSRKNASSATPAPTIPSDNELVGKSCPLCGKGTIIKGKPRMAAQNGKTGVPTGSLSDNHIFLVRSQTNLYIIEYKQVCTRRSIAPVYKKQYAQSSRTNLWLLLAYKRKFFG